MDYLVDTGVLLRLFDRTDPAHDAIRQGLLHLRRRGAQLAVAWQNIAEFWNVSTRPVSARGGYGQSIETTERRAAFLERFAIVHAESPAAYRLWRRLLVDHRIQGLAVHDARLVAIMMTTGIAQVVTLNVKDFARYPGSQAISPKDVLALA